MDKNAIKKYAVWARRELIEKVSQKAIQYGIENSNELDPNADSINGKLLTDIEKRQRQALIKKINEDGFEQVIEEVAYTWFNRFVALRFMEVNGYLPSHIRVFTDENNCFNPQILTEALHVDLESLDREKVLQMKEANQDDELYKCLIIAQCNDLSAILPGLFQKISDYTELLLPDYLLRKGSVIEELVDKIPEDNFNVDSENGQVEIIGWMYQYYNDEKKSYVINLKNSAVKRDDVPAATQLFTTDWVVRYIADNTIGRYWVEHNGGDVYKSLTYYVGDSDKKYDAINPKDLTVFDPCVGSGHFLVYAFDVLLKIYLEFGYSERDAAKEIVENNLFGIDIDARATQLAYFAVMMKARACDRRFFSRNCRPNIYEIRPSDHVDQYALEYFCKGNEELRKDITTVLNRFDDAKEYGSVLKACDVNWGRILQRTEEVYEDIDIYRETVIRDIIPIINAAYVLSSKYAVVITNPPYLNKYSPKLKKYVTDNYKDYSGDLFSVFIYRNFLFCKEDGYTGFMTPYVWMFIKTYEKLRQFIINSKSITSLIQMEYSAFEEATVPICSFVLSNKKSNEPGSYFKLSSFKGGMEVQKQKVLEAIDNKKCGYYYERQTDIFRKIPGSPIAFWAGDNTFLAYDKEKIADSYIVRNGISTGDNDRFLRLWHEVDNTRDYWKPCNKGGSFRKWYGNNEYVVYWKDDGHEIRTNLDDKGRIKARLGGIEFSFQEGIEMSRITSGELGFRFSFPGFVYESSTNDIYVNSNRDLYTLLGYCNSAVVSHFLGLMNPTINIMPEDLRGLPCFEIEDKKSVTDMVVRNIEVSKCFLQPLNT